MHADLSGHLVYLRDFIAGDWPAVHAYASDPEVVRFMSWGPNTPKESMAFTANAVVTAYEQPRTRYELAVIRLADQALIGGAGLYVKPERQFEAEMGYCLRRDVWGQGFGSEVAKLLVKLGFSHLHLHRIYATCDPQNHRSARILQKAGMHYEGRMRDHMELRTGWRDSLLYAIIETDVRALA